MTVGYYARRVDTRREKQERLPDASLLIDCKTVRIFAYSSTRGQSNKRCGTRLKTESETGERRLRACETREVRVRKTLTPRFTDFFTDFEEKTDCFAVYASHCLPHHQL